MDIAQFAEKFGDQLVPLFEQLSRKGYLPANFELRAESTTEITHQLLKLYEQSEQGATSKLAQYSARAIASAGEVSFSCEQDLFFAYDPQQALFSLEKVSCTLFGGKSRVSEEVEDIAHLPPSEEMVRRLVQRIMGRPAERRQIGPAERDQRLEQYVQSYHELLVEKGYTGGDDPEMAATMQEKLRESFERMKAHPLEAGEKSFRFRVEALLLESLDRVDFLFHFKYDPARVSLDLEALTMESGDYKLIYPVALKSHFPSMPEFLKTLNDVRERRNKQEQSKNKGKRPGL